MSEKVTQLADRCGFPPKIRAAGDAMCDEVWKAIEKAEVSGVPMSMIIGFMEMVKLEILSDVIDQAGEPA
ncbi:TPA: hypothetical protein ACVGKX_005096 [Pseudomonas aeruginosa]|uniref:hypothetical protein n=1 Tax=Pseudomonas aeruginosa TaxID=287 RepID=UPI0008A525F0|nr:hypothetical protein [Pseudomonas aeruginosa]EKY1032817.1 hypothetical protein [Pseudomonas aeruginosa]OFL00651.1 hypothetical protein HMPREF2789_00255 [Pseudomonas aeruginosa]HEK2618738.1 hypothetical protein [Pseudomonas aeruginosa]